MNTDAYYEIGSLHKVCEDYALAGQYEDMAYAILSDGCSSSKDSDVGARLLVQIAKGVVIHLKKRGILPGETEYPILLIRELILRKCIEVRQTLGLSPDIFDATLLISTVVDNKVNSIGWGDGYFITGYKDGMISIDEVKYTSGAPFYLSYELSKDKKDGYLQQYGNYPMVVSLYELDNTGKLAREVSENNAPMRTKAMFRTEPADKVKFIALSSDGIDTYQDDPKFARPDGGDKMIYKAIETIPYVVGYKSTVGEFVVRRMLRHKADMEKDHVLHFDDVSCAAIALE